MTRSRIWLAAGCAVAGLAANVLFPLVPLGGGLRVHLGGVAGLVIAALFGWRWGAVVAAIASAPFVMAPPWYVAEVLAAVGAGFAVRRGSFLVPPLAIFWAAAAIVGEAIGSGGEAGATTAMSWLISGLAAALVADAALLAGAVARHATPDIAPRGFGAHVAFPLTVAAVGPAVLVAILVGHAAYPTGIFVALLASLAALGGSTVIGDRVTTLLDGATRTDRDSPATNPFLDLSTVRVLRDRIALLLQDHRDLNDQLADRLAERERAYAELLRLSESLEERLQLRGAEIEERSYLLDLSQRHYRDAIEQATDIIFTLDLEGKFLDINAAGEKFFGHRIPTITGRRWHQMLAPGYDPSLGDATAMLPILEALHTEGTFAAVSVVQAAGGEIRLLDTRLELVRDEDGMPMNINGVARDVTQLAGLQEQVQELGETIVTMQRRAREREQELEALLRASRSINSELEIDSLLQHIIESAAGRLGAESGFVGLLDEGALALRWYWRATGASWIDLEGPGVERGITEIVLETRRPYLCADAATDPNSDKEFTRRFDVRSMLLLPIFNQSSEVLGAMALHNFPIAPTAPGDEPKIAGDPDMRIIEGLVDIAAAAIQQSRLFEQVRQQAETDPLTGLYNRRAFNSRFEIEIERASRFNRTVALILLDIDHLKKINDSFGHPIGDAAICTVADVLQSRLRRNDFAARIGGEEFAVLVVEGKADTSANVARSLLEALRKRDVPRAGHITASLGIAVYPEDASTRDELFRLADTALYRAKNSGRNRVVQVRDSDDESITNVS